MSFYNVINAPTMQAGQPEDVSQVLANFNAIAGVLNGGLDNANVANAAAIARSKLDFGSGLTNVDVAANAGIAQSKLAPIQIARIASSNVTVASADGFKTMPVTYENDAAGLGTIVGSDYRMDVGGAYLMLPSLYSWNLGTGSLQRGLIRQNPAGPNYVVTEVYASSGVVNAGDDRWIGGTHTICSIAANDVIRLQASASEATPRNIDIHLAMIRLS